MLVNAVTYTIPENKVEEALVLFEKLTTGSRAEPGCLMYVVHQSISEPTTFFLYEQWHDRAALDNHYEQPHFKEFGVNGIRTLATDRVVVLCEPIGE